jgi:hypothetical protein
MFEKNLGKDAAASPRAITHCDPDPTWTEIKD